LQIDWRMFRKGDVIQATEAQCEFKLGARGTKPILRRYRNRLVCVVQYGYDAELVQPVEELGDGFA